MFEYEESLHEEIKALKAHVAVLKSALFAAKYATKPSITLELIETALSSTPADSYEELKKLREENERLKADLLTSYCENEQISGELAEMKAQEPVGTIVRHTGSLGDMAIIVWSDEQPPIGTVLYARPAPREGEK